MVSHTGVVKLWMGGNWEIWKKKKNWQRMTLEAKQKR